MSKAILLNANLEKAEELALPENYNEINSHNLYIYAKAYLANIRESSACVKTRSTIQGGGRKPFAQKGGGRARQGSIRAPQFRGGSVAHGPKSVRNFTQKVNKKQQRLALAYALKEKATAGKLYLLDDIKVESGKTKDAAAMVNKLGERDVLVVKEFINFADDADINTFLAFRNLKNAYLIEANEVDAYLLSTYHAVVMQKSVFETLTKED